METERISWTRFRGNGGDISGLSFFILLRQEKGERKMGKRMMVVLLGWVRRLAIHGL
jgi:hypothetical protein